MAWVDTMSLMTAVWVIWYSVEEVEQRNREESIGRILDMMWK